MRQRVLLVVLGQVLLVLVELRLKQERLGRPLLLDSAAAEEAGLAVSAQRRQVRELVKLVVEVAAVVCP
jgi:hypothetical protein